MVYHDRESPPIVNTMLLHVGTITIQGGVGFFLFIIASSLKTCWVAAALADWESTTTLSLGPDMSWSPIPMTMTGTNMRMMKFVPSPDCWLDAVRKIYSHHENNNNNKREGDHYDIFLDNDGMATDVCSWMTTNLQKLLALELARCHISDLGKHLFLPEEKDDDSTRTPRENSQRAGGGTVSCSHQQEYADHLVYCLTRLTPSAETAYTHFLTYIHQLCIRLSKEVVMNYFYETSIRLAKTSTVAEEQMKKLIQQQEDSFSVWKDQHDETILLQLEWQQTVQNDRIRWEEDNKAIFQRYQDDNKESFQRYQDELMVLKDKIAQIHRTTAKPTSWSAMIMDAFLQSSWFHSFCAFSFLVTIWFHVAGTLLIVRILTYPSCLRWFGQYLSAWIVMGGLIETLVLFGQWSSEYSTADGVVHPWATTTEDDTLQSIRGMTWVLGVVFYLLGIIVSPCLWRRPHRNDRDDALKKGENNERINSPLSSVQTHSAAGSMIVANPRVAPFTPVYLAGTPLQQIPYYPPTIYRPSEPPFAVIGTAQSQSYESPLAYSSHESYSIVPSSQPSTRPSTQGRPSVTVDETTPWSDWRECSLDVTLEDTTRRRKSTATTYLQAAAFCSETRPTSVASTDVNMFHDIIQSSTVDSVGATVEDSSSGTVVRADGKRGLCQLSALAKTSSVDNSDAINSMEEGPRPAKRIRHRCNDHTYE